MKRDQNQKKPGTRAADPPARGKPEEGTTEDMEPRAEDQDVVDIIEADVEAMPGVVTGRLFSRGGVLAAFGHRDFSLLWGGAFVSNMGTLIHNTVLLWYVYQLTHANSWVAAVNFANFAPIIIFVLWAGSLADRVDRRRLILWSQVVMMFAALTLGITTSLGVTNLWIIMVVTLVIGTAFALNFPAWRALVPDIVPREDLLNAVALDAAGYNMARFLGPTLGTLILYAFNENPQGAFYINAASFLAVIVALLFIKARPAMKPVTISAGKHIKEGIGYVRHQPWAVKLLAMLGISTFFGLSYIVLLPAFASKVLHGGPLAFGLLVGGSGLGASISAPLVTRLNRSYEERDIIKVSMTGFSLSLLLLATSRYLWLSALATVFLGITFLMVSASVVTVLQSRVEREMRGRIMSYYILVFQGSAPVGGLLLGYISDVTSAPTAMYIGGGIVFLLALATWLFPSILRDAYAGGMEAEPAVSVTTP
jgi:MFS family permease